MNIINAKVARRDVWMDILLFHAILLNWFRQNGIYIFRNPESHRSIFLPNFHDNGS